MIKFLHISDTHFHGSDEKNIAVSQRFNFIEANYPEHIKVITGDITDDGSKEQYEKAAEFMNRVEYICPGNHDYGYIGSIYSADAARRFDEFSQAFFSGSFYGKRPVVFDLSGTNVVLIVLNSCLKTGNPFDFACGEIGFWQRRALKAILDNKAYADAVKIVMLHHHPFIHSDPTMELLDAEKFMRILSGKVDALLFGHKHMQAEWRDKMGIRFILAAGSLFESDTAKEIVIAGKEISVAEVKTI